MIPVNSLSGNENHRTKKSEYKRPLGENMFISVGIQCGRNGMRETELIGDEVGEAAGDWFPQSFWQCLDSEVHPVIHQQQILSESFHVQPKMLGSILEYVL